MVGGWVSWFENMTFHLLMELCFTRREERQRRLREAPGGSLGELSLRWPDARMDLGYQCCRRDKCHWRGTACSHLLTLKPLSGPAVLMEMCFLLSPRFQVKASAVEQCRLGHGLVTQRPSQNAAT